VTTRALGGDAWKLLKKRVAVRILRELDAHPIASVVLPRILFQTVPALNYALATCVISVLKSTFAARV